jgi:uncharacterized OB-fold protein
VLEQHWKGQLDDQAFELSQAAVDLEAAETRCPACGTAFQPTRPRCPGCGLRFG